MRESLARRDPLSLYMSEVRRYPLVTPEQEHVLAVHYAETGDVATARRLITANLRLVVKIAHDYHPPRRSLLDMVQAGNVGLMLALPKYDARRGIRFTTYAAWWIRAYILKWFLDNWHMVKIGTTQAKRRLFFNLRNERDALEQQGFSPNVKELARRLGATERDVTEMQQHLDAGDLSLDAPIGAHDQAGRSHLALLEASGETRPDVAAEAGEFRALLRDKVAAFAQRHSGRERTIFEGRLHTDEPLTLQEIGARYGMSRERVRQLEDRLADKLRIYLRAELGDAVDARDGLNQPLTAQGTGCAASPPEAD